MPYSSLYLQIKDISLFQKSQIKYKMEGFLSVIRKVITTFKKLLFFIFNSSSIKTKYLKQSTWWLWSVKMAELFTISDFFYWNVFFVLPKSVSLSQLNQVTNVVTMLNERDHIL